MASYISVLATKDGYFCAAPPWSVKEGDFICLPSPCEDKAHEVVSVVTDEKDGDIVKMIEKYIGYPLPKIHAKYHKSEVVWDVQE
jgi:hypothetical protein